MLTSTLLSKCCFHVTCGSCNWQVEVKQEVGWLLLFPPTTTTNHPTPPPQPSSSPGFGSQKRQLVYLRLQWALQWFTVLGRFPVPPHSLSDFGTSCKAEVGQEMRIPWTNLLSFFFLHSIHNNNVCFLHPTENFILSSQLLLQYKGTSQCSWKKTERHIKFGTKTFFETYAQSLITFFMNFLRILLCMDFKILRVKLLF